MLEAMKRTVLLAVLALVAASGCESRVGSSMNVESESLALSDPAVFPPRVDTPIGATKEQVCGRDDGDMKKAFADYAATQKKSINPHPPDDITKWVNEGDYVYTCRFCNLDGMKISVPQTMTIRIEDSSARGLEIFGRPVGSTVHMKNVYARGLKVHQGVNIDLENVDARCGWDGDAYVNAFFVTSAKGVDLSGTGASWIFRGPASDVKLTGAASDLRFDHMALSNARFDGLGSDVRFDTVHVSGDVRFDNAGWFNLTAIDTTFTGGSFQSTGAHGWMRLSGKTVFDGVDLSKNDGGLSINLDAGMPAIQAMNGTKWPVGKNHLVADEKLGAIDFGAAPASAAKGASLVTTAGEVWPAKKLDLTGLRLTHGRLPAKADLTQLVLDGAHLERVDLSNVGLAGTATQHASFVKANLQRAELGKAKLEAADFTNADLRGANLASASGTATFTSATAGVLPAKIGDNDTGLAIPTSFTSALLGGSHFERAQLQYAGFKQATLTDVHFDGAILDFANFGGASFHRSAGIANRTLANAASAHGTTWDGADLRETSLAGLDLSSLASTRSTLIGAWLCGADLRATKLNDADLTNMFFDVDGDIALPDRTAGACKAGDRTGVDTRSVVTTLGTRCPLGGHAPEGGDGACTAAQWKLQGQASCTAEQTANALDDGAPCSIDCDCQSVFCGKGTCQEKAKANAP